jgi:hypothetical protein
MLALLGGWLGLCILGLLVVAAIVATELENFGWATVTVIAMIAGAQFFNVVDVLDFVKHNAVQTALWVLAYLAVGVVWSFVKWFSYLISVRDRLKEAKINFCNANGIPLVNGEGVIPPDMMTTFMTGYTATGYARYHWKEGKVNATDNKGKITAWMMFWPYSLVGTLLNDPVRRIVNFLFSNFKALYQRMVEYVFRDHPEMLK